MTEVITPVFKFVDETEENWYVISPNHTISDIARWLIENDWHDEVEMLVKMELAERPSGQEGE